QRGAPGLFRLREKPAAFRTNRRAHVRHDPLASLPSGLRPPRLLRLLSVLRRRNHGVDWNRRREFFSAPTIMNVARLIFLAALSQAIAFGETEPAPDERHVVIVVWDGMRPDFVTERNTPALWKLAQEGVTFRNNHAVYPSATHVNGAALLTGVYPDHSGLAVNYDYRPDIDDKKFVSTEQPE